MLIAPRRRAGRTWLRGVAIGLSFAIVSCDSILEVEDPDIVPTADSPAGAVSLHNGVLLRMVQATTAGGDNPDGLFLFSGLVADEWQSGDTFEQRNTADQRQMATTNSFIATLFNRINKVRTEGAAAIAGLREFAPAPESRVGLMFSLIAFSENQIGEVWCNGIPFSELDGSTILYGEPVPYNSAFRRAANHADSAAASRGGSADSTRIRHFASVIKGRALLNLNLPAAAATAVASVPTAFVFQLTHSVNTADNVMWLQNISLRRYVMGNGEGGNGLAFRSANDPRLPPGPTTPALAFDGNTPYVSQGIWTDRANPVTIASGIEARLIEAEAAMRANDAVTFLAKLNEARATKTGLAPLADPGTPVAREDLLFRERAFWLFGTGHRLGDLRRLVRQYNRAQATVFPAGTWFKGGPYGSDVNLPVPFNETNNPNFTACTDRNA
jgi:starch-binding outer membrane protein, SusD/RagB family